MKQLYDRGRWAAYELHAPEIKRYVARRVEPDAVDDVVSEIFVTAWRRLPRDVATPDWLLPWLYGVARRVIKTHQRGYTRRRRLLQRVAGERDVAHAPDIAELFVGDPQLQTAFATLTEREQEAIALTILEQLDRDDAAKAAGCSPGTFAVRLSRARAKLTAQLGRQAPGHAPPAEIARAAPTPIGDRAAVGR